ncbi:hypothetical protein O181_118190 [Austropuccinia psidii MF-1]|uniref:Uncharacterized protein n=1 Tax=Austropuccinia psidii MF-1 TaxID=1389203 RepID=A0A9Q3KBU4_9BASI|nr:hypothetical protein [Austropuccinia psidii MF-1]
MLTRPHALQMRLQHCPLISVLTTTYALPTPLILTLVKCPPDMLLTLAKCPPNTAYHSYARKLPSHMLPTLLTILTLPECTPDNAYHPYARGVHSQHAPNTGYHPSACVVPS